MNALIILFYRIVPFFTSITRKTRDNHSEFYEKNPILNVNPDNGFIMSQEDLVNYPYGHGNLHKNGCGAIALYNTLVSLGLNCKSDKSLFSTIVYFLEKRGLALYGKLGTSPFVINSFLKKQGLYTKAIFSNKEDVINDFSKSFDTFISVFYNNFKSIKYGIHIVFVKKNEDGTFTAYNPFTSESTLYRTLSNCSDYRIKNLYTIGVKR